MFGVGFFELILIAVVALVVVGPKRLPEVMRQAGRLFVHFRRTANEVRSTFDQVIRQAEEEMRREETDSLRQALKPMQDVHQELKTLISGGNPESTGAAAPGSQPLAATAREGDHPIEPHPLDATPAPAPANKPESGPTG